MVATGISGVPTMAETGHARELVARGVRDLSPAGNNCVGEMEAVGMRRAILVNPFLVLKEAGTSTWGERLNGSPAPYTSHNYRALFLQ